MNLFDDDIFLTSFPTFESYRRTWDVQGGLEVEGVPDEIVCRFYFSRVDPEDALHAWFVYSPVDRHYLINEVLTEKTAHHFI